MFRSNLSFVGLSLTLGLGLGLGLGLSIYFNKIKTLNISKDNIKIDFKKMNKINSEINSEINK